MVYYLQKIFLFGLHLGLSVFTILRIRADKKLRLSCVKCLLPV